MSKSRVIKDLQVGMKGPKSVMALLEVLKDLQLHLVKTCSNYLPFARKPVSGIVARPAFHLSSTFGESEGENPVAVDLCRQSCEHRAHETIAPRLPGARITGVSHRLPGRDVFNLREL